MTQLTFVAVYGTLRQGNGNHRLISRSESAEFIGTGKLTTPATMFTNGGFPYLSFLDTLNPTVCPTVEVYAVDAECLRDLDRLEGYPGWYDRSEVQVKLENLSVLEVGPAIVTALVYHQDKDFSDHLPVVESGDWMEGRRRA